MEKKEYQDFKKAYIEEVLNKRKYFGYRLDLVLIKLIIVAFASLALYITTADFIFTVIIASEIFLLLTLINRILVEKKAIKGKTMLAESLKKQRFKKKVFSSNHDEMDSFILLYLNLNRYYDVKKIDNNLFYTKKNDKQYYVSIIKLFDGASVEKIDLRNIIYRATMDDMKDIIVITANNIVDEAKKMIEELDEEISINIINFNDLYSFVNDNSLLSTNYENISDDDIQRRKNVRTIDILSNIFNPSKIKIYMIAAVGFYMLYRMFLINYVGMYVSYYFLAIALLNFIYNCFKGLIQKKK